MPMLLIILSSISVLKKIIEINSIKLFNNFSKLKMSGKKIIIRKKRRGNLYQRIVHARRESGHKNNVCCRGHLRVDVCKKSTFH